MDFARRTDRIRISGIRRVFEAAGADAINLGLGQPDFPAPDHARRAAVDAIERGDADGYTSNAGIQPLREAIAAHGAPEGVDAEPANVIATSGASEALHLAIQAHVDPGDEVLIPDPGFVSYDALAKVADADPVGVPLDDQLRMPVEATKERLTDDTAAIVVNSPANPTGAVQTEDQMRGFAELADDHDVVLISDEVYDEFVYDGQHHSPATFAEDGGANVVTVNAASKRYAMTGWRLGWVVAAEERVDEMIKVHQYVQACASAPAQYAAEAALTGGDETADAVAEMKRAFEERRDLVLDGLADAGLDCPTPRGAFYAFPEVPEGFVDACLERDVVTVPGSAFGDGGAGHARLSYAASVEELEIALERIADAVAELR